jgi:hypothetical protein
MQAQPYVAIAAHEFHELGPPDTGTLLGLHGSDIND